jgi:hypothetical protein
MQSNESAAAGIGSGREPSKKYNVTASPQKDILPAISANFGLGFLGVLSPSQLRAVGALDSQ